MVNLNNFVLNEKFGDELKCVPEVNMPSEKMINANYVMNFLRSHEKTISRSVNDKITFNERIIEIENENYVEPTERYKGFKNKFYGNLDSHFLLQKHQLKQNSFDGYHENDEWIIRKYFGWQEMLDYMGIIPFTPSVMINISPDWKALKQKRGNHWKWKNLEKIILAYMKEDNRYDYYSYVIENGATGEHVHAHIVAHINPSLIKSVIDGTTYKYVKGKRVKKNTSHLGQGRHVPQLIKYAAKTKGMEGMIKGQGVQITILRNEILVRDKLDYLIEDKKPEGHKNRSVLSGKVDVVL